MINLAIALTFGFLLALGITCYLLASQAFKENEGSAAMGFLIVATICTGIAAGMAYGGGV